ncbi:Amidohydrolase [Balamuthia mandrillaris]
MKRPQLQRFFFRSLAFLLLLASAAALGSVSSDSQREGGPATLVIQNVKVWRGGQPGHWQGREQGSGAVAVVGDRIAFVGSSSEAASWIDPLTTKVIDGGGEKMLVPGFVDSHIHLLMAGFGLTSVQLRDAPTKEEFVQRIGRFAEGLPPGAWVREGSWDHTKWTGTSEGREGEEAVLPAKEWIDGVTPENPVLVCRLDGHMCLANGLALRLANISRDSPEVPGGTIVRDSNGEPTGILKDNAMQLVWNAMPPRSQQEEDEALSAAMSHVLQFGVTSVHHMSYDWNDLPVFERAHQQEQLRIRIYVAVPLSTWQQLAELKHRRMQEIGEQKKDWRGDEWLRVGNLKAFTDGSLGSHTALMFEPLGDVNADSPSEKGLMVSSEEDLYNWVSGADSEELHVSVHAIGDKANHILLNVMERVIHEHAPRDRRFRIEHAQHLRPADLKRFAPNNIIGSMQPYHLVDDGPWARSLLGEERGAQSWPFRTLFDQGALVTFGSDWFVAIPDPLKGIYAAVTRSIDAPPSSSSPLREWTPEQSIRVEEALMAYTCNAAYASFEEEVKGRIEPGYLADLVLLDRDITECEEGDAASQRAQCLWDAKVEMTIVGGEVMFSRDAGHCDAHSCSFASS